MRTLFGGIVSLVLIFQTGCATPGLWNAATRETVTFHRVEGIERSAAGNRLIVRYWGVGVADLLVYVPLEPSGLPPAPMVFTGSARTIEAIEKDLAAQCIPVIENLRFAEVSGHRDFTSFD